MRLDTAGLFVLGFAVFCYVIGPLVTVWMLRQHDSE